MKMKEKGCVDEYTLSIGRIGKGVELNPFTAGGYFSQSTIHENMN